MWQGQLNGILKANLTISEDANMMDAKNLTTSHFAKASIKV